MAPLIWRTDSTITISMTQSSFANLGRNKAADLLIRKDVAFVLGDVWKTERSSTKLGSIGVADTLQALRSTRAGWRVGALGVPDRLIRDSTEALATPLTRACMALSHDLSGRKPC